jgi:pimeloyl-ACP methyl ester carboxylesterase
MPPEAMRARLAGGLTLSYFEQGEPAGLALVLLPGPTDSWRCYAPVLSHLSQSVRAIAVSQRGHGDSDKPASGFRVEDYAGDLARFLDALGIDRAVVAGHSGAGLVARRFALAHPDRTAALVLEAAPTTLRGNAALEGFVASLVADLTDPVDKAFVQAVIGDTTGDLPAGFAEDMVQESLKVPARVWQETFASLLEYDDTGELGRLAAPVLLVWGDADDLVDRGMQDVLRDTIPDAELSVYPGIGHSPHWENPSRFATDAGAFVQRVANQSG